MVFLNISLHMAFWVVALNIVLYSQNLATPTGADIYQFEPSAEILPVFASLYSLPFTIELFYYFPDIH